MEERINEEYTEIDLLELFRVLKENIALLLLMTIVFGLCGFLGTRFLITPQYESSINMIVNTRQDTSGNVSNDNISSAKSLVDTYAIIIKSNTVLNQVIENLDLDMDYQQLYKKVSVSAVNNTQVMKVSVTDSNPYTASRIVRCISAVSPDIIVDSVEAGSCKVISDVEESGNPVSPSIIKNTALAAIIGFVFCAAIILLRYFLANYLVDDSDIQKYLGIPVLGVIPEIKE